MRIGVSEQTWIDYRPASYGSRALAYICDFLIRWTVIAAVFIAAIIVIRLLNDISAAKVVSNIISAGSIKGSHILAAISIFVFFIEWSYPVYFEVLKQGVTPGKRWFGLRVVNSAGLPIRVGASMIRNILLIVDLLPGSGFVALASMAFTRQSQRVGDLVAGTLVIYDAESLKKEELDWSADDSQAYLVPLEIYTVLENYLRRRAEITQEFRMKAREKLLTALTPYLPAPVPAPSQISDQWLEATMRRMHPIQKSFGAGSKKSSADWSKIRKELLLGQQKLSVLKDRGDDISEEQLRESAGAYQNLCQRYAYLSTFYPETREAINAARLVRFGRRLIYGRRLEEVQSSGQTFLQRVPLAFKELRLYCFFAAAVALLSGGLTALLVEINPNLGWHLINEQLASDLSSGKIWTEEIRGVSALASSKIMTNNISVSFMAFAFGVAGGFGTIVVLIFNGALLGGMFAVLAQYSMAHRLLNFICAHGFLELSIIFVAAGCGLALGDAFLNPGSLTRVKSMEKCAKPAVDLVVFSALCLMPCGLVEGFISPYDEIPVGFKLALGLTIASAYWLFLATGFTPLRKRK